MDVTLNRKAEAPPKPVIVPNDMEGWNPKDWRTSTAGGWLERTGDGPVFYDGSRTGTFIFAVRCKKGHFGGYKFRYLSTIVARKIISNSKYRTTRLFSKNARAAGRFPRNRARTESRWVNR